MTLFFIDPEPKDLCLSENMFSHCTQTLWTKMKDQSTFTIPHRAMGNALFIPLETFILEFLYSLLNIQCQKHSKRSGVELIDFP